jgi:DNA-binding transcriptional regulator YiaG
MGGFAVKTDTTMYQYTLCGLDYVYLVNGYVRQETPHGTAVSVQDVEGLHRAIADDIIRNRAQLSGQEIRFLRKEMDLSQSNLAVLLGVDSQTVARWEKNASNIHGSADRLLRVLYEFNVCGDECVRRVVDILKDMDEREHGPQRQFRETESGWKIAA